jgi:Cellulase (glycosyl hydrolase family 5)/Carbohydrate binding module (family 6)/Bacterial Ig domain/Secretion system C-terminal sorting domain
MKKINLLYCISLICFSFFNFNLYSQTAKELVVQMGPGFNLGNVFDNGVKDNSFNSLKPIIDGYAAAGMKNVRIPTTWYDNVDGTRLTDVNGNIDINHARFKDLVATVDYALSKGLYVVINTHHEHWLKDNYNGSAYYNTIFTTLWTSIANYFKGYPSKLAFEVLNEPEGIMGQWGTPVLPTAQSGILLTRQINKVGYDAIRATGGNNTTRIVMISPNGQANDSQIEEVYPNVASLPGGGADKYLAMHVHSYDPWGFCGQTGSNANYPGATQVVSDITVCNNHAKNNLGGIAVHYGEFGVGRDPAQGGGPTAERGYAPSIEYYQTFAKTCINLGIAFSVWDDRGWFSLINDAGNAFTYNIVPQMLSGLNTPPTVSITAPTAGSSYTSGTSITLTATATDTAPGTVSSVSFYDGATLLGTDTSSPYSYTWAGAAVGSHSITARATDNNGAITTSSAVAITVSAVQVIYNHILPKKIEAEQFNVQVGLQTQATTDTGGGLNIGYTDVGDYLEYAINAPIAATYTVDFRVASLAGNAGFSVLVDGTTRIAEVVAPNTGGWQNWATVTNTLALTAGNHVLRFTVTRAGFNLNWMDFKQVVANVAPTVSLTAPTAGAAITFGTSIIISATATDTAPGTVTSVSFYDGATLLGTDTSSPYSYTWVGAAVGTHSLTARATDNNGAITTSVARAITVNAVVVNNPLTQSYFHLVNTWTNDYMRPTAGGLTAAITQEEVALEPTVDSYQWEFQNVSGTNYYYIVNKFTKKAMQPTGGVATDNAGMSQTTLTAANQGLTELHWSILASNQAPYYWIQNRKSGLYIRPNAGTNGTGIAIVQNTLNAAYSSFKWNLVNKGAKPIVNTGNSKVAKVAAEFTEFENNSPKVIIFPNPAIDIINVTSEIGEPSDVNLSIININGENVTSKNFGIRVGAFNENLDIRNFVPGPYFLKISKGKNTEIKKFIKH